MKLIKLMAFLLISMSLSMGAMNTAYADKAKQEAKKQKQEAKDAKEQAVKNYKAVTKPAFDTSIANKKTAIANKKAELKPVNEAFQKQFKETAKFFDAMKASLNKLNNLSDKIFKAKNELDVFAGDEKETFKKRQDIKDLENQYFAEVDKHNKGPLKNYNDSYQKTQNEKIQLKKLINELDNLRADESLLVANKLAAKDKAKKTVKVEAVQVADVDQLPKFRDFSQNPKNMRNPNRVRVFDQQLVNNFNVNKNPTKEYLLGVGDITNSQGKVVGFGLKPNDAAGGLGKFLGGGANSLVYESKSDKKLVNKLVRLTDENGNIDPLSRQAIKDQAVGRAILNQFKADYDGEGMAKLFSVAKASAEPDIWIAKQGNITHKFALSREENISSDEVDENGKVLGTATNALDRLKLRQEADSSVTGLTPREELTINLVIRGLNQNGIVWTDHKLANLDIVKDPNSPTGHRVVFFDFDAFRPVAANTRQDRYKEARTLQRAFDQRENRDPATAVNTSGKFDFTAFGQAMGNLSSGGANNDRLFYKNMDNRGSKDINQITKIQLPTRDLSNNLDLSGAN